MSELKNKILRTLTETRTLSNPDKASVLERLYYLELLIAKSKRQLTDGDLMQIKSQAASVLMELPLGGSSTSDSYAQDSEKYRTRAYVEATISYMRSLGLTIPEVEFIKEDREMTFCKHTSPTQVEGLKHVCNMCGETVVPVLWRSVKKT